LNYGTAIEMFLAKSYGKYANLLAKDPIPQLLGHISERHGIE
jgi:hypothetical protein